jgi:hypothetical protein
MSKTASAPCHVARTICTHHRLQGAANSGADVRNGPGSRHGCPLEAAAPLAALGWVDANPLLSLDEIFRLHTKAELAVIIPGLSRMRGVCKSEWLALLRCCGHPARQLCSLASRGAR